jgi:hypothetical protein
MGAALQAELQTAAAHIDVIMAGAGVAVGPAEAWYCGPHRHEGERAWAARYRPSPSGLGESLV